MSFHVPDKYRVRDGRYGSTEEQGNNGAFILRLAHNQSFFAIASDGMGWEHVSVSRRDRCPTWAEMCAVKSIFWDDDDVVLQYHPRASEYVNVHQFCLHLWRPVGVEVPTPPPIFVG